MNCSLNAGAVSTLDEHNQNIRLFFPTRYRPSELRERGTLSQLSLSDFKHYTVPLAPALLLETVLPRKSLTAKHCRRTQDCFMRPGPPNFFMSLQ